MMPERVIMHSVEKAILMYYLKQNREDAEICLFD